jgi:hypothetical protein
MAKPPTGWGTLSLERKGDKKNAESMPGSRVNVMKFIFGYFSTKKREFQREKYATDKCSKHFLSVAELRL